MERLRAAITCHASGCARDTGCTCGCARDTGGEQLPTLCLARQDVGLARHMCRLLRGTRRRSNGEVTSECTVKVT
eukprot:2495254-Rhodomonas_salina.1